MDKAGSSRKVDVVPSMKMDAVKSQPAECHGRADGADGRAAGPED